MSSVHLMLCELHGNSALASNNEDGRSSCAVTASAGEGQPLSVRRPIRLSTLASANLPWRTGSRQQPDLVLLLVVRTAEILLPGERNPLTVGGHGRHSYEELRWLREGDSNARCQVEADEGAAPGRSVVHCHDRLAIWCPRGIHQSRRYVECGDPSNLRS